MKHFLETLRTGSAQSLYREMGHLLGVPEYVYEIGASESGAKTPLSYSIDHVILMLNLCLN